MEVLKLIKSRSGKCPIVMFTNTGNEEIAVEAMKVGLDDYIIKSPRNYLRLCVAARVAIDRSVAQQQVARAEGEYIYLWIEDNGIGIAQKDRERIFGLFDRLHGQEVYPDSNQRWERVRDFG